MSVTAVVGQAASGERAGVPAFRKVNLRRWPGKNRSNEKAAYGCGLVHSVDVSIQKPNLNRARLNSGRGASQRRRSSDVRNMFIPLIFSSTMALRPRRSTTLQ
jgi:hypothetical protein